MSLFDGKNVFKGNILEDTVARNARSFLLEAAHAFQRGSMDPDFSLTDKWKIEDSTHCPKVNIQSIFLEIHTSNQLLIVAERFSKRAKIAESKMQN